MSKDQDWLDDLLRSDAGGDYIADDGFTARVMTSLPAAVATLPAWRKPVVIALWLVAAIGLAFAAPGAMLDVAREAYRLLATVPVSLSGLASAAAALFLLTGAAALAWDHVAAGTPETAPNYRAQDHWWGMIIDIDACIGCGNCVRACKAENDVLHEPGTFRTWVERYEVDPADIEHPHVVSPNGGYDGFAGIDAPGEGVKVFFVPKLCNHCANSPCVQVCPVGATFESPDGVVLVAESGLSTADDLRRMADRGYHAVLVGTALLRAPDPGAALARLLG